MTGILIIDDEEPIRTTVEEFLDCHGIWTKVASNGAEALALLNAGFLPSAILLDLDMPVIGGREFHQRQMARTDLAGIPCIVLSGSEDLEQTAATMGVTFLRKPFEPQGLLSAILSFGCI